MTKIYSKPVNAPVSQGWAANPAWYLRFVGQRGHNGIDYAAPVGTPVRAIADGTVIFEGYGQRFYLAGKAAGIYVMLRHAKHHSGYAHLSRTIVNNGQRVKKGQVIGYSGMSGLAKGPHLHFEMLPLSINVQNGYYGRTNPTPLLQLEYPTAVKRYYIVKKGDTVSSICAKLKLSLARFKVLNPQIKNINVIYPGQKVRIK